MIFYWQYCCIFTAYFDARDKTYSSYIAAVDTCSLSKHEVIVIVGDLYTEQYTIEIYNVILLTH